MRHAILITAYKDLDCLYQMLEYFDSDFEIFIHIDKKCKEDISRLQQRAHTHIYKTYEIEWGSYQHLLAIVLLCTKALQHNDCSYFHLITGSDHPIVPPSEFKSFFEQNQQNNFVEHFPLPRQGWGTEGGIERVRYYWFRPRPTTKLLQYTLKIQRKILHTKRPFPYFSGQIYGGGTYWSVSRNALENAMEYITENPKYLTRFKHTHIPEEICFPTLWKGLNITLINNHLRYIDWSENKANPKTLDETDFEKMVQSDCIFSRKIEKGKSDKLIQMIQDHIKN